MFSEFTRTEIVYTQKFTGNYEDNEIIRFYDNNLQDISQPKKMSFPSTFFQNLNTLHRIY